jgi:alpha-beta hydrolase superfamily lysophospholipase
MKTKYPNLKIFMCGMSLGGAVAFNISVRSPKLANGLILLSPSIRENSMHYPLLKKFTVLLSLFLPYQRLLKSSARNGSKYKLDDYSKKDPYLYHGRLWAKTVQ